MGNEAEVEACGCTGLSRAQLMRRAASAAVPGDGLPAIEQGMPTPAGTGLSRRSFVSGAAGFAMAVYGASKVGWNVFDEGIAQAAALPDRPILVSVFMEGGMDSLTMLSPASDAKYQQLRPTLKVSPDAGTAFSEDSRLRWHPSAAGLSTLHGEGKVSVVPAVGYTGANQSHFTSRHYWETGALSVNGNVGWMGRYLDRYGAADNPLQGLSLSWDLSPALAAAQKPVATVANPADYSFWANGVWDAPVQSAMLSTMGGFAADPGGDAALRAARDTAGAMGGIRESLAPYSGGYGTPSGVTYPTGTDFAKRLQGLAAMIKGGLPLRCVALNAAGGYDTHSDQSTALPRNLKLTSDSLLAFQRDLEARGIADRVLVLLWSEFGRRPQENGSGTDHGAGGSCFLIGSRAKGRMVGEVPGLSTLDPQGNLRSNVDFRDLYRALLDQWFAADADAIVPTGAASTLPVLVS